MHLSYLRGRKMIEISPDNHSQWNIFLKTAEVQQQMTDLVFKHGHEIRNYDAATS